MKKGFMKKTAVATALIVLLFAAYFIYSKPVNISQLYPMLTLDKCTGISGCYADGTQAGLTEFTIDKGSEEFETLCSLLYDQDYHRSLRDLLPRGTRIHPTEPGDFQWDVHFCFEDVEFPDGSRGSGAMLHIQSWYGELDIDFNGETHAYRTSGQEVWSREVFDIIQ